MTAAPFFQKATILGSQVLHAQHRSPAPSTATCWTLSRPAEWPNESLVAGLSCVALQVNWEKRASPGQELKLTRPSDEPSSSACPRSALCWQGHGLQDGSVSCEFRNAPKQCLPVASPRELTSALDNRYTHYGPTCAAGSSLPPASPCSVTCLRSLALALSHFSI